MGGPALLALVVADLPLKRPQACSLNRSVLPGSQIAAAEQQLALPEAAL